MQNQITTKIQDEFPDTHYFVYKSKQYPIKWKYFKLSSNYFSRNSKELKSTQKIYLINDDDEKIIEITEQIIQDFINYVQRHPISINKENAIVLYYLSKKYEVNNLLSVTKEFIQNHYDELVLDLISIQKYDEIIPTEIFEQIIAKNIIMYINDDRLISLPIPTIYRILSLYYSEKQEKNQASLLNEFILKCFDKHGQPASVLFAFFRYESFKSTNVNRLISHYSRFSSIDCISKQLLVGLYDELKSVEEKNENQKKEIIKLQQIMNEKDEENNKKQVEQAKIIENKEQEIIKLQQTMHERDEENNKKQVVQAKIIENKVLKIIQLQQLLNEKQ